MVELTINLDNIFHSLADSTRRDILKRVSKKPLTIGEIAKHYKISFAAISKHLKVMEKASLIVKHRKGKEQVVQVHPKALMTADEYLSRYREQWEGRLDRLEKILQ